MPATCRSAATRSRTWNSPGKSLVASTTFSAANRSSKCTRSARSTRWASDRPALYRRARKDYLERGDTESLARAQALVGEQQNLSIGNRERLFGYLEGGGRIILPEPKALLTEIPQVPGIDGRKMSKSYNNAIRLRESPDVVEQKVRTMVTDPARVRREDPGDPRKCPVFALHEIYSDEEVKAWAADGCRSAGIGCVDCKGPLIDAIAREQAPFIERAEQFENNPDLVRSILLEGSEAARVEARETLDEVKSAMGIAHR